MKIKELLNLITDTSLGIAIINEETGCCLGGIKNIKNTNENYYNFEIKNINVKSFNNERVLLIRY